MLVQAKYRTGTTNYSRYICNGRVTATGAAAFSPDFISQLTRRKCLCICSQGFNVI